MEEKTKPAPAWDRLLALQISPQSFRGWVQQSFLSYSYKVSVLLDIFSGYKIKAHRAYILCSRSHNGGGRGEQAHRPGAFYSEPKPGVRWLIGHGEGIGWFLTLMGCRKRKELQKPNCCERWTGEAGTLKHCRMDQWGRDWNTVGGNETHCRGRWLIRCFSHSPLTLPLSKAFSYFFDQPSLYSFPFDYFRGLLRDASARNVIPPV